MSLRGVKSLSVSARSMVPTRRPRRRAVQPLPHLAQGRHHLAQPVEDQLVAGAVFGADAVGGGGGHPVLQAARAHGLGAPGQQQVRRMEDHLRPAQGQAAGGLGEGPVEADHQADGGAAGREHREAQVARAEDGLLVPEQMHLAVEAQGAVGLHQHRAVVDRVARLLAEARRHRGARVGGEPGQARQAVGVGIARRLGQGPGLGRGRGTGSRWRTARAAPPGRSRPAPGPGPRPRWRAPRRRRGRSGRRRSSVAS